MDLETFFPADKRFELAMSLNNLLAAPGFGAWMEGEPLDIQRLLYTPAGKPRVAILSIAHLDDAERMFFVSLLLNQVLGWMRQQPGTTSLRAIVYMDEIAGYLPPVANPASKAPMLTLLKQARAFGVGMVLATQNPVDLDYKALSNAGTWFIGRLQTERDQARVLDGLEGAATTAGGAFDRNAMSSAHRRARQAPVPAAQRARGSPGGLREPLGDVVSARPADAGADKTAHGGEDGSSGSHGCKSGANRCGRCRTGAGRSERVRAGQAGPARAQRARGSCRRASISTSRQGRPARRTRRWCSASRTSGSRTRRAAST